MAAERPVLIAGVVGHPVSHSLSPDIFAFLSKEIGIPLAYRRLDIPPKSLRRTIAAVKPLELFLGWNVTIPHKQKMVKLVDELAPEAKVIGAVNVVKFLPGGKARGHNTDAFGVAETLREQRVSMRGKSAIVFGAGGAALSVGYVLGSEGARSVWIVNRTQSRGRKTAERLNKRFPKTWFHSITQDDLASFEEPIALYVNSTPLGMQGFPDVSLLPDELTPSALAFDLVYRPAVTAFLRDAKQRGLRAVGGLDMLIWQALATWEIWFERKIPAKARVKAALRKHLEKRFK